VADERWQAEATLTRDSQALLEGCGLSTDDILLDTLEVEPILRVKACTVGLFKEAGDLYGPHFDHVIGYSSRDRGGRRVLVSGEIIEEQMQAELCSST